MNQKIQSLLDGGFISISDVLEYAQQYMDGVDKYDDEQIDKYYQEEYMQEEYIQQDYDHTLEWPDSMPSLDPEYIIASTSYNMEETYVFEANENGQITNYSEYSGITKRFGCDDWHDYYKAVVVAFGKDKYQFVRRLDTLSEVAHFLFKRVNHEQNCEPEYPLPSDTWDGGFVQEP